MSATKWSVVEGTWWLRGALDMEPPTSGKELAAWEAGQCDRACLSEVLVDRLAGTSHLCALEDVKHKQVIQDLATAAVAFGPDNIDWTELQRRLEGLVTL